MDGRVKTLHPMIHGALLGPTRSTTRPTMAEHGIEPIDLLVVNLYPFEATVAKADCTRPKRRSRISISVVRR